MFAEQVVDRLTVTEVFQGKEYPIGTGRVVLHAMSPAGLALCRRDGVSLASVARPWDEGYLPHLPRCAGCAAVLAGAPDRAPGPGAD